jgi:hypothetical protein
MERKLRDQKGLREGAMEVTAARLRVTGSGSTPTHAYAVPGTGARLQRELRQSPLKSSQGRETQQMFISLVTNGGKGKTLGATGRGAHPSLPHWGEGGATCHVKPSRWLLGRKTRLEQRPPIRRSRAVTKEWEAEGGKR